jgi:hypothetical protein
MREPMGCKRGHGEKMSEAGMAVEASLLGSKGCADEAASI